MESAKMESPNVESSQVEAVQPQPAQTEPAQTEPAQVESENVTATQTQPTQMQSVEVKAASVEPIKIEAVQTQPTQTEPAKVEPENVVATQTQPTQTEPLKEEAANVMATQTEPAKLEAVNMVATQTQSTQMEPAKVEAANVEIEAAQTQPTQTEPVKKIEIAKVETTQVEPVKLETANVEPTQIEGAEIGQEPQIQPNQGETDRKRLQAMEIEIDKLNEKDDGKAEPEKKMTHDDKMEYEENAKLRKMVSDLREALRVKNLTLTRKNLETEALEIQITALKEVTILSKGMLDIRNTENLQLKEQIDNMQEKITAERERHNSMLHKAERATSINSELQTEYHKQVALFGELKESYEKKLLSLQSEIKRLEALQNSTPP